MSSLKIKSVKVINNPTRLGLIHIKVKDIKPYIIKEIEWLVLKSVFFIKVLYHQFALEVSITP